MNKGFKFRMICLIGLEIVFNESSLYRDRLIIEKYRGKEVWI